jgi:hypothetical protein
MKYFDAWQPCCAAQFFPKFCESSRPVAGCVKRDRDPSSRKVALPPTRTAKTRGPSHSDAVRHHRHIAVLIGTHRGRLGGSRASCVTLGGSRALANATVAVLISSGAMAKKSSRRQGPAGCFSDEPAEGGAPVRGPQLARPAGAGRALFTLTCRPMLGRSSGTKMVRPTRPHSAAKHRAVAAPVRSASEHRDAAGRARQWTRWHRNGLARAPRSRWLQTKLQQVRS